MADKRKHGSHMRIRTKLMIYFSILLSIPILILGIYTYLQSKANMERQSQITIENNLSGIVMEMDARAAREATYIKYLAYNLNFRKLLEETPVNRVEMAMELNNSVEPILWYYITSDDYVKSIEIATEQIDTSLGSFLKPAGDYAGEDWYISSKTDFSNTWTYQDGQLFISRSILDAASVSKFIGIMRVNLFPGTFLEPFEGMQYLGNGILVLDGSGNTIYSRLSSGETVDKAVLKAIRAGDLEDTSDYILRSAVISTTGWTVYYYVDSAMVTGQLHSILLRTLQVVGAVILIAVVVIYLFSRSLSKRILLLKESAERVASGDLDTVIETEDTDEIGIVINSFGHMTQRLNHMINEIYKMQLEKKAVELKALQAQINPHFLYNALSSIKWKAIRQGNDDISDVTGLLATFYRTSLNNGESFTTVENELENIRAYIELQRHMHEFPFEVVYEIQEGARQLRMLNFLLQPIVENAFKHGIDYTDETRDGRIVISCCTQERYLLFTIKNNGPEISRQKAEESLQRPGKRYGIYNIQERIDLYYGGECGLRAGVDESGYTYFTVKILKTCTKETGGNNIK